MHKDATATRIEGLEHDRAFEEKFGREMTLEEKRFIGLSDEMFKHESLGEPLNPRRRSTDNGSQMMLVPNRTGTERRKKVA